MTITGRTVTPSTTCRRTSTSGNLPEANPNMDQLALDDVRGSTSLRSSDRPGAGVNAGACVPAALEVA